MEQTSDAKAWGPQPRRRTVIACNECKRRKVRCTGTQQVCETCKRHTRICVWPEVTQRIQRVSARTVPIRHVPEFDMIRLCIWVIKPWSDGMSAFSPGKSSGTPRQMGTDPLPNPWGGPGFDFNSLGTYPELPGMSPFGQGSTLLHDANSTHTGDRSIEQGTPTVLSPNYNDLTARYFGQATLPSVGGPSPVPNSSNHAPTLTYSMPGGIGMSHSMQLPSNLSGNTYEATFNQPAEDWSYSGDQPPSQENAHERPSTWG